METERMKERRRRKTKKTNRDEEEWNPRNEEILGQFGGEQVAEVDGACTELGEGVLRESERKGADEESEAGDGGGAGEGEESMGGEDAEALVRGGEEGEDEREEEEELGERRRRRRRRSDRCKSFDEAERRGEVGDGRGRVQEVGEDGKGGWRGGGGGGGEGRGGWKERIQSFLERSVFIDPVSDELRI